MSGSIKTNPESLWMHIRDIGWVGFDFDDLLPPGVTLSGAPTVFSDPAVGLSISLVQINATEFQDAGGVGKPITAGNGVIALVDPSATGSYKLTAECPTSDGYNKAVELTLAVGGE